MTELNEDNYRNIIMSYTSEQWKPLLDLIPILESNLRKGEDAEEDIDGEIYTTLYYRVSQETVYRFKKTVYYIPIFITNDFNVWDDYQEIIMEEYFDYDYDTLDIPEKCRIIGAIVDVDQFEPGFIKEKLTNGCILMILRSIKKQLKELKIIDL